jgi:hypothetical protein
MHWKVERTRRNALKGVHLLLRAVGRAPEQRAGRVLRDQARSLSNPDGKRVLILAMRDWAAHVSWEMTIAQALRLRGADVHVVTCGGGLERCDRTTTWEAPPMPCTTCSKYVTDTVRAHGFTMLRLSDFRGADDGWPELDSVPSHALLDVEADGLPIGRLAEIPTKWFLLTTKIAEDPIGPSTTRAFLRSTRQTARAMRQVLDEVSPDVVLVLNGLFLFEAVTIALCQERAIDVVNYERGFLRETLFFARDSLACFGDVTDVWPRFRDVPLSPQQVDELERYLEDRTFGRRSIEQYWRDVRFETIPRLTSGKRVTLFTNLTWDSAVINKEIAYPTIQEWISDTIRFFAERPEHELVIRIHPAEVTLAGKPTREPLSPFIHETFPALPANVIVVEPEDITSSYPLMAESDAVTVFTSTTGLEAALAGVPVIVSGETHYRNKGFTIDVDDPPSYHAALESVLDDTGDVRPDIELVRRYAYLFFFRLPIPLPRVREHVPGLVQVDIPRLADLAAGNDPDLDRICDGILHGGNFRPG